MEKKSGWANNSFKVKDDQVVSFKDVMNEQLAFQQELDEDIKLINDEEEARKLNALLNGCLDSTAQDYELAKKMQEQFDQEELNLVNGVQDTELEKKTKNLKLNDEKSNSDLNSGSEDSDREWDMFEKTEKQFPLNKYFKHDLTHCSRMNACKTMNMNISTGDGGGFDMKLNNNVYNSLKTHANKERKRITRLNEKCEKSTAESVMDEKSKLLIFKLIDMGIIDECNGIISTGKESNVYHGIGCNIEKKIVSGEVAIKIFKTTLNEFKNRSNYIRGDYRFNDRLSKQNTRKRIYLWAEKEMHNLFRLKKAGILCPDVIMLKKQILVMSFIGKNGNASPTLREAVHLNSVQLESIMLETKEIMKKMYYKCDLVHGDLSEYNLIYHNNRVYVIDVGQSVLKGHPNALKFLLRDCQNISRFFYSRGLTNMISASELFCEITGLNKNLINNSDDVEILQKIRDLEKDNQFFCKDLTNPNTYDLFDEMFNKSLIEKESNQSETKMSVKNSLTE